MATNLPYRVFEIRPITPLDAHQAYRLRYEVMAGAAKPEYLDHAQRMWIDPLDRPGSLLVGAYATDGALVGTQRVAFRVDGDFLVDWAYQWTTLASLGNVSKKDLLSRVALLDRGCVSANWRRMGIHTALVERVIAVARERSMICVVGAVTPDNERSRRVLERGGFQSYGDVLGSARRELLHLVHWLPR